MNPFKRAPRRRQQVQLSAEVLETRQLLTGGAGNTFAILPSTIDEPNGTVSVSFTLDQTHFTRPKGKVAMGIDVVADPSGTLKPLISSVTDPHGDVVPQTIHAIYDPQVKHRQVANGRTTSAVISPITSFPSDASAPVTFTTQVQSTAKTTGKFLLGFYLPGDTNGDGTVDKTDLKVVRSLRGAKAGDKRYSFDADANRDGRITQIDVAYTQQNQGVTTTISPVIAANLDTTSVSNPAARANNMPTARFTGTATPDADVTYTNTSDTSQATIKTKTDSTGNYTVVTPLSRGENVFEVTSVDAFGQTIKGRIAGVTYQP
ncbi:dockerin type I domain-containing protein [Singulisphaera sp. Ch08]|uniref:Dockerin type I domain-containing protein n=1 Tax=Singulisphaera sp. Ch08 TaxID=3120278 RepID=A0AAU7CBN7_9BACT